MRVAFAWLKPRALQACRRVAWPSASAALRPGRAGADNVTLQAGCTQTCIVRPLVYQVLACLTQPVWDNFMREVEVCANHHPYLVKPSTSDLGRWASCGVIGRTAARLLVNTPLPLASYRRCTYLSDTIILSAGAFLGFCCVNPGKPVCLKAACSFWSSPTFHRQVSTCRFWRLWRLVQREGGAQEL